MPRRPFHCDQVTSSSTSLLVVVAPRRIISVAVKMWGEGEENNSGSEEVIWEERVWELIWGERCDSGI
ncbi:hypothetical protein SESBI_47067 [Sesbania bispinosa]|nr:hypothetical protein SESBI_47067 [Sesbania bispinosa]